MDYECVCDYDPPDWYERRVFTARKMHKCYECSGIILPGEQYEHVVGKWEGDVSVFKTCERCVDLRTWVKNNVPCLCWAHGNSDEDLFNAVDDAQYRAPTETVGLRFGLLRRFTMRDKRNARVRGEVPWNTFS